MFGTLFTPRLSENLREAFVSAGASASESASATASLDPQTLATLPPALRDGIVNAYADALAPVFWYLVPFIALAFLLALTLKQIPLSDVAGLVARGEAVGGSEAEELERAQRATREVAPTPADRDQDPGATSPLS